MDALLEAMRRERDEAVANSNRYIRFLAIAVQRLGGRMVVENDDEAPVLKIAASVLTAHPVDRAASHDPYDGR